MQIFHGGKLSWFRGLASNREGLLANFFLSIIRCFELLYNGESFPANNKKDHTTAKLSHCERFALYDTS